MRTPRIYLAETLQVETELILPQEHAHYLIKVLRLEPGHAVIAFNGQGGEFWGKLTGSRHHPKLSLHTFNPITRDSPLQTILEVGVSKGERLDWIVQKATELGVDEIHPLQTSRSVRRLAGTKAEKNRERWTRIAASACEQCGRNRLPYIAPIQDLRAALAGPVPWGYVLDIEGCPLPAMGSTEFVDPVHLLIGPEGGLTEEEIGQAEAAGYIRAVLGPRTLRTETAAVAALVWAQIQWGDGLHPQ